MTQAPATPPSVSPLADNGFVASDSFPRWSAAAITGFVMSFLLVLAPLGIILGIVGIVRTWGGKRRGMGLSIAAIPIGLIVGTITTLFIVMAVAMFAVMAAGRDSTEMWRVSRVNIVAEASEFYTVMSPRFRVKVTEEAFQAWATGVSAKHGALQAVRKAKRIIERTDGDRYIVNFTGDFVNGSANIAVTIGLKNNWTPEIDNIDVDGVPALADG